MPVANSVERSVAAVEREWFERIGSRNGREPGSTLCATTGLGPGEFCPLHGVWGSSPRGTTGYPTERSSPCFDVF